MIDIQIKINTVSPRLEKIRTGMQHFQPLFDSMKDEVIQEFKANFAAKGTIVTGSEWAPRKKNYAWPILNRTGKLKNSWDSKVDAKKLTISNPVEYATYHHFGTPKLPQRKLVGPGKSILQIVKTRVEVFLKNLLS